MVTKILYWVSSAALLAAATWRPSANYQILLHFLVCAGAVFVVLAVFFIKHRVEIQYLVDNSSDGGKHITVRL